MAMKFRRTLLSSLLPGLPGHEVCWAQQQFAVQNKECVGDPVGAGPELTSELYD